MRQIEYKKVIVRPRIEPYDVWLESEIQEEIKFYGESTGSKLDDETNNRWYERLYWDRCSHWFVVFPNDRIIKIPKRKYSETDEQWETRLDKIITKVEKENKTEYGKFSATIQKVINKQLPNHGLLVYPTTYGIGLWAFYNWNFQEQAKEIESILEKYHIEYKTEYSDAGWVFRYKISKKEVNRLLLENLK